VRVFFCRNNNCQRRVRLTQHKACDDVINDISEAPVRANVRRLSSTQETRRQSIAFQSTMTVDFRSVAFCMAPLSSKNFRFCGKVADL